MSTTIAPATGAGVLFTQQGVGTTPGYSAIDLRRSEVPGPIQEGVYANGDYMVTQRGAGANLSVDIAASGAFAAVQGDSVTGQGLYTIPPHSAVINEVIAAADATNPRIDQVILEVLDNVHDSSGANLARTRVLTGTPTGGATLTNRTGAAALPSNACRLADVLVAATDTAISNSEIRDRRPWARGAYARIPRTSADITTSATTYADLDSSALKPRVECSGVPLRVLLFGEVVFGGAGTAYFVPLLDGGAMDGFATVGATASNLNSLAAVRSDSTANQSVALQWTTIPAAGSHQFSVAWGQGSAVSTTLRSNSGQPLVLIVEEIVKQNTANNTTTTG